MGTDSVIYIRTDGNSKIATGHFVRCLCIAEALETLGKRVCFLVSDTDSADLLQDLSLSIFQGYSFSFDVNVLQTAVYNNLEQEQEELKYILTQTTKHAVSPNSSVKTAVDIFHGSSATKPVIFIDSYYVTPTYLNTLRTIAKVAYMDDLRAFNYAVDLVINYDVIPASKITEYNLAYTNASTALLGAMYTPLRRQFQNQNTFAREKFENILITTGGSDPYRFTETIIPYLLSQNLSITLHVVVGKLFKNTESLEELAKQNPSVRLYYNVSDMAGLMKQCDYAVSAAGTTLYELCALGIPTISFTMADNQIIMAETFAETGAVPYAGDLRADDAENIKSICNHISAHLNSLLQNPSLRIAQQKIMHCQTDGNGAVKIAQALCNLFSD